MITPGPEPVSSIIAVIIISMFRCANSAAVLSNRMQKYKEVSTTATLIASAYAVQKIIQAWYAVYKASAEKPWVDGQQKPFLIFDRQRLVFLDVGGSVSATVRKMLLPLLPPHEDGGQKRSGRLCISDKLNAGQSDYHCFACVDNPFERLVQYLYPAQMEPFFYPATTYPGENCDHYMHALEKTVKLILSLPDHALPVGLRTQYDLLHKNGRPLYQTLCHSKTFTRDIAAVAQQYGLSCDAPLADKIEPVKMLVPSIDYRSLYTPDLIDSVAGRYRKDIDAFGYQDAVDALYRHVDQKCSSHKNNTFHQTPAADTAGTPAQMPNKPQQRKTIISYCALSLIDLARAMLWFSCATDQRPLGKRYTLFSEEYPSLFYVLNHKCASTSIRNIMQGLVVPADVREPARTTFSRVYRRIRYSFLVRLFEKSPPNKVAADIFYRTATPFRFSFVRDPFHRLVSCYRDKVLELGEEDKLWNLRKYEKHLLSIPLYDLLRYQKWPDSFADFVSLVASTPDHLADVHFRSQYTTLYENGELLVDYIGKVEDFAEDMRYLCDRFDLPILETGKLRCSSESYDYRDYYTPELVERVAQRYRQDIEAFGYQQSLIKLRRHTAAAQ